MVATEHSLTLVNQESRDLRVKLQRGIGTAGFRTREQFLLHAWGIAPEPLIARGRNRLPPANRIRLTLRQI